MSNTNMVSIASSIMCKFDFVPSKELAKDGPFDGCFVLETAHQTQPVFAKASKRLADCPLAVYNGSGIDGRFSEDLFRMGKSNQTERKPLEIVEPIGKRVVIRKDEDKKQTKGGIQLPDNIEIPTITGRIVSISVEVENTPDIPLRQYDKVLFNPKGAIPVDFEGDNRLFVVEVENVVAVFRKA